MNQIIITGNVGKDAEKGQYDVHFTVATTRTYKDRNGEQKEKTVWHNVSYVGKAQDLIALRVCATAGEWQPHRCTLVPCL